MQIYESKLRDLEELETKTKKLIKEYENKLEQMKEDSIHNSKEQSTTFSIRRWMPTWE